MLPINKILQGDCFSGLKKLPDNSIDCCVTSPPYWGLRDYGHSDQLGLEKTPELYVAKIVDIFREIKRVLKKDGNLWLNLGDSYAGSGNGSCDKNVLDRYNGKGHINAKKRPNIDYLKPKDLVGIPWMVAFALRADGWYLRQDIIWSKPNPMPESVTDRCTKSHEYIFLLSKSPKYYFDYKSIQTPMASSSLSRLLQDIENQNGSERVPGKNNDTMKAVGMYVGGKKHKNLEYDGQQPNTFHKTRNSNGQEWQSDDGMANKRSVWNVTTKPFKEAHFATFPQELIVDCIKAGCPERKYICNSCGFNINLYESNTKANETIYKDLQKLWDKVQRNRPMEQRKDILHKEMQFCMDSKKQDNNEGVDNFKQRIQNDCSSESSKQIKRRICNGTQVDNGKGVGEIIREMGGSPSQGFEQTEQQYLEFGITDKRNSRQITETTNKIDYLSSLWKENKSIGTCPKCSKGELIATRGIILDCFMGAGTTAVVARKQNRNYIGFELNPEYIEIANKRLYNELGMFL